MGRGVRVIVTNFFTEEEEVRPVRDDRRASRAIRTEDDLDRFVRRGNGQIRFDTFDGLVASEIVERGLVNTAVGRQVRVNADAVQREAQAVRDQVIGIRFEPQARFEEFQEAEARDLGVTRRQFEGLSARREQGRALAILTAARAGEVEIDRFTRGILNNLSRGEVRRAIFGPVNPDTGERRLARGRFFTELGFDEAQRRRERGAGFVGTESRLEERRMEFLLNTGQLDPRFAPEWARQRFG